MSQRTLQKPDAQFLAQANTINSQCHAHPEWNIEIPRLTTFDGLLSNCNTNYALNNDRATSNHTTSANKKASFAALKHFLGSFIDYLIVNTDVPDAALEYMGLRSREHHAHHPLPRPTEAPVISVRRLHEEITVYVARPEQDHPTEGVGLPKYHHFMLRYKIEGEADYKTDVSSRLHHTLFFEHEDRGKRVTLTAAWMNPSLEAGPWSDEITEIIG